MKTRGILAIVIIIALALLGFSCSSAKNMVTSPAPTAAPPTTTAAVAPSPTTTTPAPAPTTTAAPAPTTTAAPTATTAPTVSQPTPTPTATAAPVSTLDCKACHSDIFTSWSASPHATTQSDVADELSTDRANQTPYDVIQGPDSEDCIACHGPTAVLANGGMTQTQALGYFFSTSANGTFGAGTAPANMSDWSSVTCTVCHNVPANHPSSMPTLSLYDSVTGQYKTVDNATDLCGQCHGNLLFSDTDHLTYNAWSMSKHAATQADVAHELSTERVGQTPADVITGSDAEDCIACHAPTAILANGGMTETQALNYFFTTTNGTFTKDTTTANTADWPNVSCITCHDPHNPKAISYFNSSTGKYETMKSADELCGQCHGNLRFPDTDHLSYNIMQGTGGTGVADMQTMPGATCTDCHMYDSGIDGTLSNSYKGHAWSIMVKEADGTTTVSCDQCHKGMDANSVEQTIKLFQSSFQTLDATAEKDVSAAADAIQGSTDATLQAKLSEAQHNMTYAESDESGGFHNHNYLMALLKDADSNALAILSALGK